MIWLKKIGKLEILAKKLQNRVLVGGQESRKCGKRVEDHRQMDQGRVRLAQKQTFVLYEVFGVSTDI